MHFFAHLKYVPTLGIFWPKLRGINPATEYETTPQRISCRMQPAMCYRFLMEFNLSDVGNHIPYTIGKFIQAFNDPMTIV